MTRAELPVLRPLLPTAERLLPYLRRIDDSRIYTNWGPLSAELESRLCDVLRVPAGSVVSAGSGTAALVAAILAAAGRATDERRRAVVPAFTFVATAHAVEECGYDVFLADVDPATWSLDPQRLADSFDLADVGLVVPVAPFGRPVPQASWRAFREQTGIPVAIDAAASFELADAASFGDIPVALSFHATKSFSTGEGGCVVVTEQDVREDAMQALNFGFRGAREATSAGVNGKLSEYHAAVGLAELDGWDEKHTALLRVAETYRRRLKAVGLEQRLVAAPEIASCYVLFRCRDEAESVRVADALGAAGIDHRRWYDRGLQHESYFREAPRERLDVTEELAAALLGLAVAVDLEDRQVGHVVHSLAEAIEP